MEERQRDTTWLTVKMEAGASRQGHQEELEKVREQILPQSLQNGMQP